MKAERPCEDVRLELSARLDGEVDHELDDLVHEHLATCAACRGHEASLRRVRAALRVGHAEEVPDLTRAILARVRAEGPRTRRIDVWRARVRTGLVAAAASALLLGGTTLWLQPEGSDRARAGMITDEVRSAARRLDDYHARFEITERNWHPRVRTRRFTAEIWFRAPERLRLSVHDLSLYPDSKHWPHNDVDLVANERRWWIREPSSCPTGSLPFCGSPSVEQRSVVKRIPFDGESAVPTDIIVPLETLASSEDVRVLGPDRVAGRDTTRVELPYRQALSLVESLQAGGDWRPFHPLDEVRVWLDDLTWFPLRFQVRAGSSQERSDWAQRRAIVGDRRGDVLLDVRATEFSEPDVIPEGTFTVPVAGLVRDGHFRETDPSKVERLAPGYTGGLRPYRAGRSGGGRRVLSYYEGLTWLRATIEPRRASGYPLRAEEVQVAGGRYAYYQPSGAGLKRRIDMYGTHRHVHLESNLPRAELLRVASSLDLDGLRVPRLLDSIGGLKLRRVDPAGAFAEAAFAERPDYLPAGYEPRAATLARSAGGKETLTVYYRRDEAEFDGLGIRITQSPARLLPATSAQTIGVLVGESVGRWSPERGELEWVDDGTYRAIAVPSFDLTTALLIAEGLG